MNFSLSYPSWFVLLCIASGLLLAFLLYRKRKDHYPSPAIYYSLAFIRFLVGTILAFLLLSPVLKYMQNKEEKPTIAFIQDNSASQKFGFKKIDSLAYKKNVLDLLEELRKDYNVREYSMGNQLNDSLRFDYNEQSTDISSSMELVMTTLESENLGGIIIASDGIYNKGISPVSMTYPYKGSIYTIGLGDTNIQKDALVARVFANKIVYLGDQFAIRSDVAAYAAKGSKVNVTVFSHNANRVITSQNLLIGDDRFSKSIETILDAKVAGVQHYTISVSKIEGEQNLANNSQDVYVEVIDSKENVLIVANSPHPDVFALRDALSKNKNYKIDVETADKANAKINEYNLIILHNLPSTTYNSSSIIDQAKKLGISIWYITGSQTNLQLFNQSQDALQISTRGLSANDAQGVLNTAFSYFTINASNNVSSLPPLAAPFGEYKTGPNAQVLMNQKLGGVTTQYPLFLMQQSSSGKVGVLAGEGLWRWRLYDYNQHKNHTLVDDYLLKTAQYLSVKHDKKQFRTTISKSVYTESESVSFDAELYNENYELINTPDVNLILLDSANKKYPYTLNKNGNSYSLNIGNLAPGKYGYTSSTSFNGKNYTATGNLMVIAQNIEEVNTTADFGLLNQLAKNYGGEFVYPSQVASLKEKIKNNQNIKTILRSTVNNDPLIDWKWLFALLLALLSIEWFVRKRSGNY